MKGLIFLLFLTVEISFGYEPTLESLLRNASNVEVGKNTVVANLNIQEVDPATNQPLALENNQVNQISVKFLVYNENEERPRLTQVEYKGQDFVYGTLFDVKERSFKRLSNIVRNPEAIDAQSFYSLLAMLLNNDGSFMIDLFRQYTTGVKFNQELINPRKLKLLGDYKNYLVAKKQDTEALLENPLKPEAQEQKDKVKEIMQEGFLRKDNLIKRIKHKNKFLWAVDQENLQVKFDTDHRLQHLRLTTTNGSIAMVLGRFLTFGPQFEFPEFVWFTDSSGRKYKITAAKIQFFQDSSSWHQARMEKYEKAKKENNFSEPPFRPDFLL